MSASRERAGRGRLALRSAGAVLVADGIRRLIGGGALRGSSRLVGAAETMLGAAAIDRAPVDPAGLYRLAAPVYDRLSPIWRDWLYREPMRVFDQAMVDALPPDGAVLDLGCGTGAVLEHLLAGGSHISQYVGVDRSPAMLARAVAKFGERAGVRFERLDLRTEPLPPGPFDLVVSAWALEHLPDPGAVVRKAVARLRPGGHAVLFFEVEGEGLRAWLLRRIWRFFGAPLVPPAVPDSWPGLVSLRRFEGAGPGVALVVLRAEDETA